MVKLNTGDTLRVLLVGEQESLRDDVGEALADRVGDHRLYWVSQPDLAIGRVQDVIPHIILVDDALEAVNPVSLIGQLAGRAPGAAIVALVDDGNMAVARQAVLAGARGFLMKPLQVDELATTLRQVLSPGSPAAETAAAETTRGRVVVFCAPKGGTGRTTLAINSALGLRELTGDSLVLVDADYASPALDVGMSLYAARDITDILPRLNQLDPELLSGVLAGHASGIKVLLAPPPADLSQRITLPKVQQILSVLRRMFDWVIVDLGLPLDETGYAFLDGADRIVMTVLPEMVGLRNTRSMLDQLHGRGHPEEKIWLVLNRSTMKGGISRADIETRLGIRLKHTVPDDQPLVTHSINRGVPLMMSHPHGAVARAVRSFAGLLSEEVHPQVRAVEAAASIPASLFARLRGSPHAADA